MRDIDPERDVAPLKIDTAPRLFPVAIARRIGSVPAADLFRLSGLGIRCRCGTRFGLFRDGQFVFFLALLHPD